MKESTGTLSVASPFSVRETTDRFQNILETKGAKIYARINQQAELHRAGLEISPMEFLLFGKPEAGGKIILENVYAALDLPLKLLVWEDALGKTWVTFNEAGFLEARHHLERDSHPALILQPVVKLALNL